MAWVVSVQTRQRTRESSRPTSRQGHSSGCDLFSLLFFFHWPCHPKDAVEFTNRKCSTETGGVGDLSKGNVCHFEVSHLIAQQPIVPACARTQCWRATLDGAGISVSIHAHTEASRVTANILVVTVRLSGAPSKLGVTLLLLMG